MMSEDDTPRHENDCDETPDVPVGPDSPVGPDDGQDAPDPKAGAPANLQGTEGPEDPEARIADLNDRLLRSLAELENTRRRAERDRGEALAYGATRFARDMVGVVDNLQRALKAADDMDAAVRDALPDAARALLEGIAATERDLLAALARHKVTALAPMGAKFDPNMHEALFEAPDTGQESGTIIEVVETGYMIRERLLRPAKVGIAKD